MTLSNPKSKGTWLVCRGGFHYYRLFSHPDATRARPEVETYHAKSLLPPPHPCP